MPATPGVSGALEKRSYGVFGESGKPPTKPAASGPTCPGPDVFWSMNVVLSVVANANPSGRGIDVGAAGDAFGTGDPGGAGGVCAAADRAKSAIKRPANNDIRPIVNSISEIL
jgi:hypothetical protein